MRFGCLCVVGLSVVIPTSAVGADIDFILRTIDSSDDIFGDGLLNTAQNFYGGQAPSSPEIDIPGGTVTFVATVPIGSPSPGGFGGAGTASLDGDPDLNVLLSGSVFNANAGADFSVILFDLVPGQPYRAQIFGYAVNAPNNGDVTVGNDTNPFNTFTAAPPEGNEFAQVLFACWTADASEILINFHNTAGIAGLIVHNSAVCPSPFPDADMLTWHSSAAGDWNDVGNWDSPPETIMVVPNGNTKTALFDGAISAPRTVYTDTAVTVNRIEFDNANAYAVAGLGSVSLETNPNPTGSPILPTIKVTSGSHQMQVAVNLNDNTTVTAAAGTLIDFNNQINRNGNDLNIEGAGQVNLNTVLSGGGGGAVNNSGTLGGAGSNVIGGDLTSTGTLDIDIGGTSQVYPEFDSFIVSGTATLDGLLNIDLIDGFLPSGGDMFDVVTADTIVDNGLTLTGDSAGFSYSIVSGSDILRLTFDALFEADFDGDGDVDGDDFLAWQSGFGTGTTHAEGDADLDGDVDGDDFLLWQSDFGSGGGSASSAVPEPASWLMLVLAAIGLVARRGRKNEVVASLSSTLKFEGRVMRFGCLCVVGLSVVIPTSFIPTSAVGADIDFIVGEIRSSTDIFGDGTLHSALNFYGAQSEDSPEIDIGSGATVIFDATVPEVVGLGASVGPGGFGPPNTPEGEQAMLGGDPDVNIMLSGSNFNRESNPDFDFFVTLEGLTPNATYRAQIFGYVINAPHPGEVTVGTQTFDFEPFTDFVPPDGDGNLFAKVLFACWTQDDANTTMLVNFHNTGGIAGVLVHNTTECPDPLPVADVLTWNRDGAGDWNIVQNWAGPPETTTVVPDGNTKTAVFGGVTSAPRTVFTDTAVTVNRIVFDSLIGYGIAGLGSVELAADNGTDPTVEVVSGNNQMQVAVSLSGNTTVTAAAFTQIDFNNEINRNGNDLTIAGAGLVNFNNIVRSGGGGGTTVSGGVLGGNGQVNGDLTNDGTVAPGNSPGKLTVAGDYTQMAGATLEIEIGGTLSGLDFDLLKVLGDASVNGILDVTLIDSFEPGSTDTFTVLTAAGELTDLGLVLGGPDARMFHLNVDTVNDLILLTLAVPEPASWLMLVLAASGLVALRGRKK